MKKYLFMALTPLVFIGCSGKVDTEKVERPEILKVESKYFNKDIKIESKCGEANFENSNAKSKLKKVNSTLSGTKDAKLTTENENIRSGSKSTIGFCKMGHDKLEVKIDINLYNEFELVEDGETFIAPEYHHDSTTILERERELNFDNFKIVWTYEDEKSKK